MRKFIISVIRKRNPAFTWHDSLPLTTFFEFVLSQAFALIRGGRVLLSFRKPNMMLRGKRVAIRGITKFKWGRFVRLGDGVHINAIGRQGISMGNSVGIGAYSRLIVSGDITNPGVGITIGNNVGIGEFAYLGGAGGLEIGDQTIVGQYFSCHPENHKYKADTIAVRFQGVTRQGIKVGSNCWIGSKVTILDGVTIGDNCIIAAGAVVTQSFPNNSIIGGVPAKLIKHARTKTATYTLNNSIEMACAV